MPEKPLLIFPSPSRADRETLPPGSHGHQVRAVDDVWRQCGPRLSALVDSMRDQRANLQSSAVGIEPEMAVVLEVDAEIQDFYRCVARIDGLEWLVENCTVDEDMSNIDAPKDGRLYLVMSNQTAMEQLLSLWQGYRRNVNITFERGLGKFKNLFRLLRDVRRWDVRDRLYETGIEQDWRDALDRGGAAVEFEIELWFRENEQKRHEAESAIGEIVRSSSGRVTGICCIGEIRYHALRVTMPANQIRMVLESGDAEFIRSNEVMFVRPCAQFANRVLDNVDTQEVMSDVPIVAQALIREPVIAVLDGCPLMSHVALSDRIILDDPDGFSEDYEAKYRIHGTSMASIVLNGDLGRADKALTRKIYVRPIFKVENGHEAVPSSCFAVDLLHRAVKRLFEQNGDSPAVASGIKVINLSLGDTKREFFTEMSPLARLIDWLSYKYNVLFIISAGNHADNIRLNVGRVEFDSKTNAEKDSLVLKLLEGDRRNRRLLSPAESVNAITVGAVHRDGVASFVEGYRRNPFNRLMPSPISSFGDGYNRSVKPDVVTDGGRMLYNEGSMGSGYMELVPDYSIVSPGVKVACPGGNGILNKTCFLKGTSCSAALTTHNCGIAHEMLTELLLDKIGNEEFDKYEASLLKAMVVHSAGWGKLRDNIAEGLGINGLQEDGRKRISKLIGYGACDFTKVMECTSRRVTLIGLGELRNEKAHIYSFPLPTSINSTRGLKRLSVTMAWITPTTVTNRRYRNARLWYKILGDANRIIGTRKEVDANKVTRGTVQHEVFENVSPIAILSGESIKIKVNCVKCAGRIEKPVRYALLTTYEIDESINADIYSEIEARIRASSQAVIDPARIDLGSGSY